jgi:hypothetical protein
MEVREEEKEIEERKAKHIAEDTEKRRTRRNK